MSSNETLEFSIAAQNIVPKFLGKLAIVYVEGSDDILFWEQYFSSKMFEIRDVNGCKNLRDYEDDIRNHGLKCVVAKDADYAPYMKVESHPLIVTTLSHSIECMMYCPHNINACLKRFARTLEDHTEDIQKYYDEFCCATKDLLVYDIANNVFSIGCSVCGNSCKPILKSDQSVVVSKDKMQQFINKISSLFPEDLIKKAESLIANDDRNLRQIMKGHFQTDFVLNLIRKLASQINQGRKPSISGDALYAQLVTCFSGCDINCTERKEISERVARAKKALISA